MMSSFPPGTLLILFALVGLLFRGPVRELIFLAAPVVSLVSITQFPDGASWAYSYLGASLTIAEVSRLSMVFGYVFHVVAFIGLVYISHDRNPLEKVAGLLYCAAATGVAFAGDFLTFFVYWEMLTICALPFVLVRGTKDANASAVRYLLFHVLGGVILLAGIVGTYLSTGDLTVRRLELDTLSTWMIFLGFGVNAGWPLLHTWIVDTYPRASVGGIVFMSALTTKTAVYALLKVFPGAEPLVWIGAVMLVFPIFYALVENDLRKVLSYSLINQVGFMVTGIGIGTELSLNGAAAHAFTHILYKALLFMSVGAVLYRTGTTKATELGGLYRSMPWTCTYCIIGAASACGLPFFSGFISKSLIISGAAGGHMLVVWLVLLFASASVIGHTGIKVPFFAFFAKDSGKEVEEAPLNMRIAMGFAAFLCIANGCFPSLVYDILPYPVNYVPYTGEHVVSQLQLVLFGILAFCVLMAKGIYPAEKRSENLDVDWFYRRAAKGIYALLDDRLNRLNDGFGQQVNECFVLGASGFQRLRFWCPGRSPIMISVALAVGLFLAMFAF